MNRRDFLKFVAGSSIVAILPENRILSTGLQKPRHMVPYALLDHMEYIEPPISPMSIKSAMMEQSGLGGYIVPWEFAIRISDSFTEGLLDHFSGKLSDIAVNS